MSKYRYGLMRNIIGLQWYQVQVKHFGVWFNDESFSTRENMESYIEYLVKNGHIIFKMN